MYTTQLQCNTYIYNYNNCIVIRLQNTGPTLLYSYEYWSYITIQYYYYFDAILLIVILLGTDVCMLYKCQ